MAKHGFPDLLNYIDNLIYVGLPSKIDTAFDFLMSLLADLGLEVSSKKLVAPATSVVCLGILIDSQNRTISIPPEKTRSNCKFMQPLGLKDLLQQKGSAISPRSLIIYC